MTKLREDMTLVEQAQAGFGYCPDCFEEHGNTVIKTKPRVSDKSGVIVECWFEVCCNCGDRKPFSNKISYEEYLEKYVEIRNERNYAGFNHEDYKFDPNNYTE